MFAATGARKRALSIQQGSRVNLSEKSVHLRPQTTRSRSLHDPRKRLFQSIVLLVILVLFVLPKIHLNWFHHQPPRFGAEGEVYMTLLSPPTPHPSTNRRIDFQFEAIRMLAYRLLHKPSTKDLHARQFVVLTTQSVPPEQIQTLRDTGVIVQPVANIGPPTGKSKAKNGDRGDQFTKLHMWNMTQYSKVLYLEPDVLVLRPLSAIFDTPLQIDKFGTEYVFAAFNDSSEMRDFNDPIPVLSESVRVGRNETFRSDMFLIRPSAQHALYVNSIYRDLTKAKYFPNMTDVELLQYAYRRTGPYPWTNLSDKYIPEHPRFEHLDSSHAIREKLWKDDNGVDWDLRRFWYFAWGEMRGYDVHEKVHEKGKIHDS